MITITVGSDAEVRLLKQIRQQARQARSDLVSATGLLRELIHQIDLGEPPRDPGTAVIAAHSVDTLRALHACVDGVIPQEIVRTSLDRDEVVFEVAAAKPEPAEPTFAVGDVVRLKQPGSGVPGYRFVLEVFQGDDGPIISTQAVESGLKHKVRPAAEFVLVPGVVAAGAR